MTVEIRIHTDIRNEMIYNDCVYLEVILEGREMGK